MGLQWKGPNKGTCKSRSFNGSDRTIFLSISYHSKVFIQGTYSQLSKCYNKVVHPAEVVEPVNQAYNNESILDFLPGFDLLTNEKVLVPAQLALSRYSARFPATSPFLFSHTNGIASGNVLEDAICHALCEVIERDAVSITELCASCIPYTILEKLIVH